MTNKTENRNLVFAFLAGITLMLPFLLIIDDQRDYVLIDAEEYFSKCKKFSCEGLFSETADIKTNKLRVYALRDISCLTSNEDLDSATVCFRENGAPFFRISKLFGSAAIYYNRNNVMTLVDVDGNGDFDGLGYTGIDDNGKYLRYVKDLGLNGIIETIE